MKFYDKEYEDMDEFGILFEFLPGDIVSVSNDIFPTGDYQQATQLIQHGTFPNRKYFGFQFKATFGKLAIHERTLQNIQMKLR